jgi:alkylation response protein AidB-like acyl-CoA dehydrogenase
MTSTTALMLKAWRNLETRRDTELAYTAKIYGSECTVQCDYDAMKVVGVMSHSTQMSFGRLMEDALCMLNFDGGKVGIRRRIASVDHG